MTITHEQEHGLKAMESAGYGEDIKEYINTRDALVEQRIKYWVLVSVLTQVIAILPIIFFLGGIYQSSNNALQMIKDTRDQMVNQQVWMRERENWETSVEMWAQEHGYQPNAFRGRVANNRDLKGQ